MKVSPLLKDGAKYQHLKAGRLREGSGMYLTGNAKFADEIIRAFWGLGGAKQAPTPIVTKLLPEDAEELLVLGDEEIKLYRHCVGIARYILNYVTEAVFAVHVLSKRLSSPTKNDFKR